MLLYHLRSLYILLLEHQLLRLSSSSQMLAINIEHLAEPPCTLPARLVVLTGAREDKSWRSGYKLSSLDSIIVYIMS